MFGAGRETQPVPSTKTDRVQKRSHYNSNMSITSDKPDYSDSESSDDADGDTPDDSESSDNADGDFQRRKKKKVGS